MMERNIRQEHEAWRARMVEYDKACMKQLKILASMAAFTACIALLAAFV